MLARPGRNGTGCNDGRSFLAVLFGRSLGQGCDARRDCGFGWSGGLLKADVAAGDDRVRSGRLELRRDDDELPIRQCSRVSCVLRRNHHDNTRQSSLLRLGALIELFCKRRSRPDFHSNPTTLRILGMGIRVKFTCGILYLRNKDKTILPG